MKTIAMAKRAFTASIQTIAVLLILLVTSGTAHSVQCHSLGAIDSTADFSCTFSDTNVSEIENAFIFTITYSAAGHTIALSMTDNDANDGLSFGGFDRFAFNNSGLNASRSGWSSGGACNGSQSAFGFFSDCLKQDGGGTTANPVFTLTGSNSIFTGAPHFAVHFKTNIDACGGFAGDQNVATGSDSDCGAALATASVPEPSALFLLGAGLIGLALWGKNKNWAAARQ